ncbi:MAG: hypothetical protein WEA56_08490 [Balneolaceae bacterium]
MLRHLIELIKQKKKHYGSDLWKFTISGNVMELFAVPSYEKDREKYRCSVIKIGQVMQALSLGIDENKINCHIQSFPSLENSALVASIRVNNKKSPENISSHKSTEEISAQNGWFQVLMSHASDNQLALEEITEAKFSDYEIDQDNGTRKWFVLSSGVDNPFTWLKIGYWNEMIYRSLVADNQDLVIKTDFCTRNKPNPTLLPAKTRKYVQAVVGLRV